MRTIHLFEFKVVNPRPGVVSSFLMTADVFNNLDLHLNFISRSNPYGYHTNCTKY